MDLDPPFPDPLVAGGDHGIVTGFSRKELAAPDALKRLFAPAELGRLIARMASEREKDNLITHPLQSPVLIEFADDIASMMSELVPNGRWAPSGAYVCMTQKRSGGFRELVFPLLVDAIVGRCVIDSLDPLITEDDGARTFCGRSHSNANREPGDYERWFHIWRDYSGRLAAAAAERGFTYVFDTDVSDFFPSIDRTRAKEYLASRTGAHASLLCLLFACLESWLPRFGYSAMTGIPIEDNDVSRLVAHNYLKQVDSAFRDDEECVYLRYVDDTVIFAKSEMGAEELKRRHHVALRAVGLNPNAAKSDVLPAVEFEAKRHREFNEQIDKALADKDSAMFEALALEWMARSHGHGWDSVMKRLYSVGRQLRAPALRGSIVPNLRGRFSSILAGHALDYLAMFDVSRGEATSLLDFVKHNRPSIEPEIKLARFFGDAVFAETVSEEIANMAILRIEAEESDHGVGYAKGLWLLALHKHGRRVHRDRVRDWATLARLVDEQFRLHFSYVFSCLDGISPGLVEPLKVLSTSDIEFAVRLCRDAAAGTLRNREKILGRIVRRTLRRRTVAARYLPLLRAMMKPESLRTDNVEWLDRRLAPPRRPECPVVTAFLERLRAGLTA